jgi:hypothetical protein
MSSPSAAGGSAQAPAQSTTYDKLYASFTAGPPFEQMAPLKTHNHLLGNQAALKEALEKDGYWFFRDVLDKGAVGRVRRHYIEELEREGLVEGERSDERVLSSGADPAKCNRALEALKGKRVWQSFAAEKPVHAFFASLLGEEPVWFPSVSYRAIPPAKGATATRYAGVHADSTANPGVPFRTCWIPLAEIDEDIGGLILAEGMVDMINRKNRKTIMSDLEAFVDVADVPSDAWRRAEFHPGDLLVMHCSTPHCGVSNVSHVFRLSIDMRILGASENVPVVGDIVTISPEEITIKQPGGDVSLKIDADTYVRNPGSDRLMGDAIAQFYKPGTEVIVGRRGDTATLVRTPT